VTRPRFEPSTYQILPITLPLDQSVGSVDDDNRGGTDDDNDDDDHEMKQQL
jgi:hypothetical protein